MREKKVDKLWGGKINWEEYDTSAPPRKKKEGSISDTWGAENDNKIRIKRPQPPAVQNAATRGNKRRCG